MCLCVSVCVLIEREKSNAANLLGELINLTVDRESA